VHDVGLEQPAEHVAEHLEGEERPLAVVRVLLVRDGVRQLLHDVQLLQGQDAEALDDAGNAWDRCYEFIKNIFVEKVSEKNWRFLYKILLVYTKNYHNIGFQEKFQFFCRKLGKINKNCDQNIGAWNYALNDSN
jgi:hypothetical protein